MFTPLYESSLNTENNVFHDLILVFGIIFGFQVVSKDPGNALPEEGGKASLQFLDYLVGGSAGFAVN